MPTRFGMRAMLVAPPLAAIAMLVLYELLNGWMLTLCASTFYIVIADHLYSRYSRRWEKFDAGMAAIGKGMVWSGVIFATFSTITEGSVFVGGFLLGAMIGLFVGILPVSLLNLLPGPTVNYVADRFRERNKSIQPRSCIDS